MPPYQKIDLQLQDAVADIKSGVLQLPEFQRKFRWKQSEQTSLLASIQRNYPVGSILLLEIAVSGDLPFAIRPFSGVSADSVGRPRYLVLDGQQRLTTCFQAMAGIGTKRAVIDLAKLFDMASNVHPGQVIDFEELIRFERTPQHLDQLLMNKNCLPFQLIVDRASLRTNLRNYRDGLLSNPQTEDLGKFVDNELEMYLDVFFEYLFPAVVLPSTLELEAIANVFTKINTTGLRLSAFDLCVAALFPKDISLRSLWELAVQSDKINRFGDDGTEILQAIALANNVNSRKASLFSVLKDHHINGTWDEAVTAYKSVADLMELVGVSGAKTLPYSGALPVLIAATLEVPVGNQPPDVAARQMRISRYLFHTAFSLRYTEGLDSKREESFSELKQFFKNGTTPKFMTNAIAWDTELMVKLGRSGARSTAIMALLNRQRPYDLINHDKQVGIERAGCLPAEVHHIFPRAYLSTLGRAEDADRAMNFTLLTRESNNFISDRKPSIYIADIIQAIAVEKSLSGTAARARLLEILKTHFINDACLTALENDDYDAFLLARSGCVRDQVMALGIDCFEPNESEVNNLDEDEELE